MSKSDINCEREIGFSIPKTFTELKRLKNKIDKLDDD